MGTLPKPVVSSGSSCQKQQHPLSATVFNDTAGLFDIINEQGMRR